MNKKRKQRAVAIIENQLQKIREENEAMYEKMDLEADDPVRDCSVKEKDDHVLLTYDGAGYEYFSMYCELETYRQNLISDLEDAGFLVEDRNNWSLTIWEK